MEFLETQRTAFPDLEAQYLSLVVNHQSRLWHQLTDALLALFTTAGASRGDNFIQLYQRFISSFEQRLNQLKFAQMLKYISAQFVPSQPPTVAEAEAAIAFLSSFVDKRKRLGEEGFSILLSLLAQAKLVRAVARPDLDTRSADLDEVKAGLEAAGGVAGGVVEADPAVHAAYFKASADYYKVRGPASSFYSSSMQYLAYCPVDTLPIEERPTLALDIALAALVGEGVFNFGEIIEHPILTALEGTPNAWLRDLLAVFHTGDIDAFGLVYAANADAFRAQPALVAFESGIKEKVALVCTMELASQRSPADRSLAFTDIAAATRLPLDQVEWLLMRAMSLGLIRGTIDEVSQVVHVSYIKPRVLSGPQIASLKDKIAGWSERVKTSLFFVEDKTRELFA